MLYSKNGSIPKPETDGTEGWIEVPDQPECPEGKEVVWWYPPGWVVRDPQPAGNWSWSQSQGQWVEQAPIQVVETVLPTVQAATGLTTEPLPAITSADISALG